MLRTSWLVVIGGIFLTFFVAMIIKILSLSSSYHLFEEQKDYLFKNTLF